MIEPTPKINTRGRSKRVKKNVDEQSTKRDPSLFEYKESVAVSCSIQQQMFHISETPPTLQNQQAPKKQMPIEYQPYVVDIKNVMADGHYGFRAVAALMGFGEDDWPRVRQDLMNELGKNPTLVSPLQALVHFAVHGFSWASTYNVAFITISRDMSLTFLPMHSTFPVNPRSICMGMVNNNHFVQVYLVADRPMPPVASSWTTYHKRVADGWGLAYGNHQIS
ncbi:hypothetical protein ACS0TY_030981 [Phlomoides rotata]